MARPNHSSERRGELLPVIAGAFAELGYRRTTTAELARRCGVQETTLYRLWDDKRAMFLASIGHVFDVSMAIWTDQASAAANSSPAEKVLAYEAEHHGELGLYRILFAGLSETDDPEVRAAMAASYRRFQRWISDRVREHREHFPEANDPAVDPDDAAWVAVGLGTIINIGRELDLLSDRDRARLLGGVGRLLLGTRSP
jgi:AcrR family transcriptional regulator